MSHRFLYIETTRLNDYAIYKFYIFGYYYCVFFLQKHTLSGVGLYQVDSYGVVRTTDQLTNVNDHVFDVIATDEAGHFAVIHMHVFIYGNKSPPEWIFPSYNGDMIDVCKVVLL